MPLKSYGVLVGRAVDRRREGGTDTPHYQVRLDGAGTSYRIAVNVKSQESPSELLYLVDDDLRHPVTAAVAGLGAGWHALPSQAGGSSLDFIRSNLFSRAAMRPLPADAAGPDNDLADVLDHYVQRAIGDPAARVYAFGERWGPENGLKDKVFGFQPGNGVHDIHMNQGNSAALPRRRRRLAGRRAADPPRRPLDRHLPRLPEPGLAHRRRDRPRDRRDTDADADADARAGRLHDPHPRRDGQPGRRLPGGRVGVPHQHLPERRRHDRLAPRRPDEADVHRPRRAARGRRGR